MVETMQQFYECGERVQIVLLQCTVSMQSLIQTNKNNTEFIMLKSLRTLWQMRSFSCIRSHSPLSPSLWDKYNSPLLDFDPCCVTLLKPKGYLRGFKATEAGMFLQRQVALLIFAITITCLKYPGALNTWNRSGHHLQLQASASQVQPRSAELRLTRRT